MSINQVRIVGDCGDELGVFIEETPFLGHVSGCDVVVDGCVFHGLAVSDEDDIVSLFEVLHNQRI